jgi:hypothetical protein
MDIWKQGLAIVQELILSPQGLGIRVLGTTDWGNPSDCGKSFFLFHSRERFGLVLLILMLMSCPTDYKIYEQVVEATHRFKSIFYDAE